MSYARYKDGVSDVYVYANDMDEVTGNATVWCCCGLVFRSMNLIVDHLKQHVADGDLVPENVIPDILSGSIG